MLFYLKKIMKKIFFIAFSFVSFLAYSQNQQYGINDVLGVSFTEGRVQTGTSGKSLLYDQISGSPYIDKDFKEAKIAENYKNILVRYNSYKDQIEYKDGEKIMLIPKQEQFNRIEILSPKQTIVYRSIVGEEDGYYFLSVEDKIALYKKVATKFSESKKAQNSYASDKPASFSLLSPDFFIVLDGKTLKNPKKEKQIIELFPAKKDALNDYFKQNSTNFKNEGDLIRLVKFLNQ